jgi:hypothetical protein
VKGGLKVFGIDFQSPVMTGLELLYPPRTDVEADHRPVLSKLDRGGARIAQTDYGQDLVWRR